MAINTIIQKYKYNSNWIGLFDLDEYIVVYLTNLMREFNLASMFLFISIIHGQIYKILIEINSRCLI